MKDIETLRKLCIMVNFHLTEDEYKELSENEKEEMVQIGRKLGKEHCVDVPQKTYPLKEIVHVGRRRKRPSPEEKPLPQKARETIKKALKSR